METKAVASVNSTEPRLPPPIQLRPLETESREAVAAIVEKHLGTNWRISHHLNPQKDAQLMSSVPIHVWKRQGRNRAGLLILRANEPAVYWNTEQDCPYTIRLQVPATFTHAGSWILVATLSKVERLLTLEDVWVANGQSLLQIKRYSERWAPLGEAFAALSHQQYFLGCELRLVEPMSFAAFLESADENPEEGTVWEFQPDVPLRRRLVWMIPGKKGKQSFIPLLRPAKAAPAIAPAALYDDTAINELVQKTPLVQCNGPRPSHKAYTKPTTRPQPRIHVTAIPQLRAARLVRDTQTALPDSYFLYAAGDEQLGRVCVPRLSQSQELRTAFTKEKETLIVDVKWNETFSKYEVTRILPSDTPLSYREMFHEFGGAGAATL